jgi:ribosomal protein L37AE/L43A
MNKRQIVASLNNIANTLDNSGLYKEANTITNVMIKLADESNSKPNLSNFDDEKVKREYEREFHCPNCGNMDERLAYDPSVIVMEKFSNGKVAWCENDNCSYDYWQDLKDREQPLICPICDGTDFYFRNVGEFTCKNERCNAEFRDGVEQER